MKKLTLLLIIGFSLVFFDVMASFISRALEIEYAFFIIGSLLLYFIAGLVACWLYNLSTGVLSGFIAGFFESTLGWFATTMIGPKLSANAFEYNVITVVITAITVTILGGIIGSLGAVSAYILKKLFANDPK